MVQKASDLAALRGIGEELRWKAEEVVDIA